MALFESILSLLSVCAFLLTLFFSAYRCKTGKSIIDKWSVVFLFISIFFIKSAISLFEGALPADSEKLVLTELQKMNLFEKIADSFIHSLQTFSMDEDYTGYIVSCKYMVESLTGLPMGYIGGGYVAVLSVIAPATTVAVILSLFKDTVAGLKLIFAARRSLFVFSEMNEKSIALAKDILKSYEKLFGNRKPQIIFTNVFEDNDDETTEMIEQAKKIKALMFKKDILTIKLSTRVKELWLFVIDSEDESMRRTTKIIDKYRHFGEKAKIYVLTDRFECEALIENQDVGKMTVRNINVCNSTIVNHIDEKGYDYFFNGFKVDILNFRDKPFKEIKAVIVGLGKYGREMIKTLSWYCQVPGVHISITGYDKNEDIESILRKDFPDLISKNYYGRGQFGDASYDVDIIGSMDVDSEKTLKEIEKINPEYVFVCLGNDALNISSAINIRSYLLKTGKKPRIETVVFNDKEGSLLTELKKGSVSYDIDCFAGIEEVYSLDNIINRHLDKEGNIINSEWLEQRKTMGEITEEEYKKAIKEESLKYWKYAYNRNSSIACAVHRHLRDKVGLSNNNNSYLEQVAEHMRWNAYMRSIGYTYGKPRNDMAKVHNLLIPFDELNEK